MFFVRIQKQQYIVMNHNKEPEGNKPGKKDKRKSKGRPVNRKREDKIEYKA